ncbi:MAG TPA: hypothetical protein VF516_14150, partial [Kofleriaceae bacterium]
MTTVVRPCNLPEVPGGGRGATGRSARADEAPDRATWRQHMWIDLRGVLARLVALAVVMAPGGLAGPAHAAPGEGPPAWANDFTARLEALALLQTLNAELLSHDSATLTLDRWCDAHHLAAPAKVV